MTPNASPFTLFIFTGKGGVGKTTCAAATALRLAEDGKRTLVVSTDPAHSLGDALQCELTGEPAAIADGLDAMEIDAAQEMRRRFDEVARVLVQQMRKHGLSELLAQDMVAFPGAEEVFCLLRIVAMAREGAYDVVVMDTAPTGNTMRFLNFPAFLSPVQKALRVDQIYRRFSRPISNLIGHHAPEDIFYRTIFKLLDEVEDVRAFLLGSDVRFRLVMTPEKLALAETQRAVSFLNISGYHVDAVIVNKLLPDGVDDVFFRSWKENQHQHLARAQESFYPLKVLRALLQSEEVMGADQLRTFGEALYAENHPADRLTTGALYEVREAHGGAYELRCQLPHEDRAEIKLHRSGPDLVIKVGYYEKRVSLPAALAARKVNGARYDDNFLVVTFG